MIRKDIMINNCKIMPLTNIHIGSGIELSPYEYVIKNGVFYRIDLGELFYKLPIDIGTKLIKLMEEGDIIKVRKYVEENYKREYGYLYTCEVEEVVNKNYQEKIAGAKNKNEENSLTIAEFIGNYRGKYVPGSSIKGSLRGAYIGEKLTRSYNVVRNTANPTAPFKSGKNEEISVKEIEAEILGLSKLEPKFDPFKNFIVTDTNISNELLKIVDVKRVNLKKTKRDVSMGLQEVISGYLINGNKKNLEFKINISLSCIDEKILKRLSEVEDKNTKEKKSILKEIKELYLDTEIIPALREKANRILKEDLKFFKEANNIIGLKACEKIIEYSNNLEENEALVKLGKGAGFNSTTLNLFNKNKKDIFTRVISENYPMGWAVLSYEEE